MRLRKLGCTGEQVSELGLGTGPMARQLDQSGVNDCVARAVDAGISYFDTAADYGNDEEMLGAALQGRRDRVFLATKVGGVDGDGHRHVDALMRQFERGLTRLRTDRVDLIQLHEADQRKWWSDDSVTDEVARSHGGPLVGDEEDYDFTGSPCVEFLRSAKEQGKARYVGVTGKDARRLARVVDAVELDAMMIAHQYNPILRNASRFLLDLTHARGVGVAVGAPFLKGWLARPQTSWRHERPDWMDDAFYQAYFTYLDIQAASGIALPELALRWALPEERVHSVVTGFERWSDIAANIEAVGRGPLPADLQSRIDAIGIVQPLRYQGRTEL